MRVVGKSISVTYSRKYNLDEGDGGFSKYESMGLEATVWGQLEADIGEEVTREAVIAAENELFEVAKAAVKTQALPVLSKRNEARARVQAELARSAEAAKAYNR